MDSGGGVVGAVEISLDGGNTWHPAKGRENWSYNWTPAQLGTVTLKSRAIDDSGNIETPSAGISITVAPHDCPCTAWPSATTPSHVDSGDGSAGEYGIKFRTDFNGFITGIRFYKSAANVGTHIGNLWTSSGVLLASAVFTNESSSGWQRVNFSQSVAINANTTYVASYFAPSGHYSDNPGFFASSALDNPPIHYLQNDVHGPNGVYSYSSISTFPTSTFNSTNYWVDVVYIPASSMPGAPPALLASPASLNFVAHQGLGNPAGQSVSVYNEGTGTLNWTASANVSWFTWSPSSGTTPQSFAVSVNAAGLPGGTYSGTLTMSAPGATNPPQTVSVSLTVTNILLPENFANADMEGWVLSPLGVTSNWSLLNQT